jgi:hypothetical protein
MSRWLTYDKWILAGILLWAICLRFFRFWDLPLTHDEYSTLLRTGYDRFGDLISKGVLVDTMPAFLQVFVHYWIQAFGTTPLVIKLPFLLMGVAAVYLMYRLGRIWGHVQAGLLAAAWLASIQFGVMYSQIARPYSSGLFFSLLLLLFWSRLVRNTHAPGWNGTTLGFVLSGALCAYNHHLGLLFLVMVGLTGLVMVERSRRLAYVAAGLAIFVLYVPHLWIFFDQLGRGGVEDWLAKPQSDWFWQFFQYINHYHWLPLSLWSILMLWPFFVRSKQPILLWQKGLWAFLFFSPLLVMYYYSVYVNAVLQFSGMIFGFPALLLLAFGHWRPVRKPVFFGLVLLVLIGNTLTLFVSRQHEALFYQSAFEGILADHQRTRESSDSTLSLIEITPQIAQYLHEYRFPDTNYLDLNGWVPGALDAWLQEHASSYSQVYAGFHAMTHPSIIPIVQRFFPLIVNRQHYFIGDSYWLQRGEWVPDTTIQIDGPLRAEFSPVLTKALSDWIQHPNDFLDLSAQVVGASDASAMVLVAELRDGEKVVHWQGAPVQDFLPDPDGVRYPVTSIKLADLPKSHSRLTLVAYLWNPHLTDIQSLIISGIRRDGNPVLYGLLAPIQTRIKEPN